MASEEETIRKFILAGKETEYVDFKEKIYSSWKDSDFVKDIVAFANCEAIGDKYLIFGITDKDHAIVGVDSNTIPDPSVLENLISEKIEPRLKIQCGSIETDGKTIFYVKVPSDNNNPPYVIRSDSCRAKQGDIFIRTGTCNRKANRADIDAMYKRNLRASIKLYSDSVMIAPIKMPKELIKAPTYGMVEVELINPTSQPLLICDGYITIKNENDCIDRRIHRIDPQVNIADNPYGLAANSRETKTLLFDFFSQDCISLGFEETGFLNVDTEIQVSLLDTEQREYKTGMLPAFLTAKGEVLWKLKEHNKKRK